MYVQYSTQSSINPFSAKTDLKISVMHLKGKAMLVKNVSEMQDLDKPCNLMQILSKLCVYGKCPKISYTKVSDKIAYTNTVDPDQTAPNGAVWSGSTLFVIPLSILRKLHKKQKLGQKTME